MLSTIILATTISTYISPTDWTYRQGADEFTQDKTAIATGQNQQSAFLSVTCKNNQFLTMAVNYPNHNQNLKTKAYAIVGNYPPLELTGKVYPAGLAINQEYAKFKDWGNWPQWHKAIKQMAGAKHVKFRLFDNQWQAQEVTFDLSNSSDYIAEVITQCNH